MDYFQTKINKLYQKLKNKGLLDKRLVGLVVVSFVALNVFWNGAKIIQQNFQLQQKVTQIEQENEVLELENRNKELQNEYLKTDEFADITARRVFGRASPGEQVYIVPESVALSALTSSAEANEDDAAQVEKPQWQRNFEAWLQIYFGN